MHAVGYCRTYGRNPSTIPMCVVSPIDVVPLSQLRTRRFLQPWRQIDHIQTKWRVGSDKKVERRRRFDDAIAHRGWQLIGINSQLARYEEDTCRFSQHVDI